MRFMKCPKKDGELESKTFEKINVEECKTCHGMWFDRGELKKAKDSTDEDLRWLDFDIFEHLDKKYEVEISSRVCPIDEVKLEVLTYSDSKIKIDACPNGHGVFLDDQEFEKIISYLENKVTSTSSGEFAKDALAQLSDVLTGPEPVASEVKDFITVLRLFGKRLEAEHSNISYVISNLPILR
jgi:uncharacterized protein